jgi:ATP-dependent Clp protease ATP-binding subunit ClpX
MRILKQENDEMDDAGIQKDPNTDGAKPMPQKPGPKLNQAELDRLKTGKKNTLQEMVKDAIKVITEFDRTPQQIKAELDKYIIGQEEGKIIMATAISYHYKTLAESVKEELAKNGNNLVEALKKTPSTKENVLIIGPSGCGKTYTAEKAAELIHVPMIKQDMAQVTEAGYVGDKVNNIPKRLILESKLNMFLAQIGIVFLDELDKKRSANVMGRDVSGQGAQDGLLKLLEGTDETITDPESQEQYKFSTKNVLFIASGAFEGLKEIVQQRCQNESANTANWREDEWQDNVQICDLNAYGMGTQLMGRFPVRSFYHQLTRDDLIKIMKESKDSPLLNYGRILESWNIKLTVEDNALELIADAAVRDGTGARALAGTLNKILRDVMFEYPGKKPEGDKQYLEVNVDRDFVLTKFPYLKKPSQEILTDSDDN